MGVARLFGGLILLVATSASAEEAFDSEVAGVGLSRDVHCDAGQSVRIGGIKNQITVTGACKTVVIDIADHDVSIERAETLRVFGSKQAVRASDAVREIEVHGADHKVESTLGGEGALARVTGSKNRVSLTLRSKAALSVAGADHQVTYGRADDVPKPTVQISGANNRVQEDRKGK